MPQKSFYKIFHSKVLLFGEHVINKGAMGLAIPFEHYNGVLKLGDLKEKKIQQSNESLGQLANYVIEQEKISDLYDTNKFLEDIEKGIYFDSDIPEGYGMGSSGALVAAVYHQYRKREKKKLSISEVKNELAQLESHFHGKSSGLDPIVCYLNKSVLIKQGEVSEPFDLAKSSENYLEIFLINTHIPRKTTPFVNLFLKKCKEVSFRNVIEKSLIPANDIAIESFMQKKYTRLMKSVKLISQLHLDLLPEFIPDKFKEVWQQGLKYNEYHLKICGAGGGGFIIGFAKKDVKLDLLLGGKDIIELIKF